MTAAKHSAPQDPSFRRSMLRNAGGALGLVVLVAAMFGVLGMIGREDGGVGLADGNEATEGPDEAPSEAPQPPDEEPAPAEDPGEARDGEDPSDEAEPTDEAPPDEPPAEEAPTEDAEDAEPEETPAEEAPAEPAIDPSTISVQVLDGYRQDGGAAADAVNQQLEDAGYNIIARNPAIAYEVTTVLWTAGHEEEGRQVAQAIGAPEVREQPGNLSSQVNVHVVVGADRG